MLPLAVDDTGAVKVVGAGVATSSDIRLRDATVARFAKVDVLGRLAVNNALDDSRDVFGALVVAEHNNQVEVNFFENADPGTLITVTKTGTGAASQTAGTAVFTTGANASGTVRGVSLTNTVYHAGHEIYSFFTAYFSTGVAGGTQRIGLYDTNNGFYIGWEGTTFGVTRRTGTVNTFVARASWNGDPLDGSAGSAYMRNGTPEAIDFTKLNVFRIRFGWLGSAPCFFEVMSPDGEWVIFHTILQPNTSTTAIIANPNLPMTVNCLGAANVLIGSSCWGAGSASLLDDLNSTVTDATLAQMVRAVLTAQKPNGTYVNIAANTQGRLLFANDSVGTDGSPVPAGTSLVGGTDGTNLQSLKVDTNGQLYVANFPATYTPTDIRGMVERMFAKAPQSGYNMWFDTADATYIYIAEAPVAANPASDATYQGIRVTKDANGNPLGEVQQATAFVWNNRSAASWA